MMLGRLQYQTYSSDTTTVQLFTYITTLLSHIRRPAIIRPPLPGPPRRHHHSLRARRRRRRRRRPRRRATAARAATTHAPQPTYGYHAPTYMYTHRQSEV